MLPSFRMSGVKSMKERIKRFIYREVKKRAMHFTLLDPDISKINGISEKAKNPANAEKALHRKIKMLEKFGTDAILVGGSSHVNQKCLEKTVMQIKRDCSLPVILFPGGLSGISAHADAIFFMSLLNSEDAYWITEVQARASPLIKKAGIEAISMGYIVIEPGMKVGEVGRANLIKRNEINKAVNYSLAAQYLGMSMVYLEAGSGADKPVPVEMIKEVKKNIEVPLIVGGGIRTPEQALEIVRAGADIVNTGNITEENFEGIKDIIEAVKGYKR